MFHLFKRCFLFLILVPFMLFSQNVTIFTDDFSTNKGWTGYSSSGAKWQRGSAIGSSDDPSDDHSPSTDNYLLGTAIGDNYPNSLASTYWITSPEMDCSAESNISLSFYRMLHIESAHYDKAYLQIYNGISWIGIYSNYYASVQEDLSWTNIFFQVKNVADGNGSFKVRFGLGKTDSIISFGGWSIDDVVIKGTPVLLGIPSKPISSVVSMSQISVSWSNQKFVSSYTLYVSLDNNPENPIIKQGGPKGFLFSTVGGLLPETKYFFWLKSFNKYGGSAFTEVISNTTLPIPPQIPEFHEITAISSNAIELSWTYISDATSYTLYRSLTTNSPAFVRLIGLTGEKTNFTDNGLNVDTKYYYKLKSFKGVSTAGYSERYDSLTLPGKPIILSNRILSSNKLRLVWKQMQNVNKWMLWSSYTNDFLTSTKIILSNSTSTTCEIFINEKPATYWIQASNASGISIVSDPVGLKDLLLSEKVEILDCSVWEPGINSIVWSYNKSVTSFTLYRGLSDNFTAAVPIIIPGTNRSYLDVGVNPAFQYTYWIKAKNEYTVSPLSANRDCPAAIQDQLIFFDDFSINRGWTSENIWEIGNTVAGNDDPGADFSCTTDNRIAGTGLGSEYPSSMSKTYWLTSPKIDCSQAGYVGFSFRRWLNVEYEDDVWIEVYDGSKWQPIFRNLSAYNDTSWVLTMFDVTTYAQRNPSFQIRFGIGRTDSSVTFGGWNIDDLMIFGTGINERLKDLTQGSPAVFPTIVSFEKTKEVEIYCGGSSGNVYVKVFDSSGKKVADLGQHRGDDMIKWSFDNLPLYSGVYIVHVKGDGVDMRCKMIISR